MSNQLAFLLALTSDLAFSDVGRDARDEDCTSGIRRDNKGLIAEENLNLTKDVTTLGLGSVSHGHHGFCRLYEHL